MTVSFEIPLADRILIQKIVGRFNNIFKEVSIVGLTRDLEITHANGCPLDLIKLNEADNALFLHDVAGIIRNLNRDTGQLENLFRPGCAVPTKWRVHHDTSSSFKRA